MTRKILALAAALSVGTLAACSGSSDAPPPPENRADAAPLVEATSEPVAEPTPAPAETPSADAAAALPPEERAAPDEQMMDDAATTGMTARASRDEPAANEAAPVEQVERK